MELNTRATRAAGVIVLFIFIVSILFIAFYLIEFIILAALVIALGILILLAIITIGIAFLMVPMYILKDTLVEPGDYRIDSNISVENGVERETTPK